LAANDPFKPWERAFVREAGLVVTYRCQISCQHCNVEAGPHRTEEVALGEALDWIGQIADYRNGRIRALSFTGGEPLYSVERFKTLSSFARERGLFASAVTNAYWASTREGAIALLRQLTGLQALSISTDVHHQKQIPFEWVENAIAAAKECGLPYDVAICTEDVEDPEYLRVIAQLEQITAPNTIARVITFPVGRARMSLDASRYQHTAEPVKSACLMAGLPIFLLDGRVVACIGPILSLTSPQPLAFGSLRERSLQEILDEAEVNPILHAIRIWGPRYLVSRVREAGLAEHLPPSFIKNSICHACYCLMSNPRLVQFMAELAHDQEFVERVAYGRVYYLKETEMVELLGLPT